MLTSKVPPACEIPTNSMSSESVYVKRWRTLPECLPYVDVWNDLAAGNPFRRWEWLGNWWKHYGGNNELCVLAVTDGQGQVIGIAPWYLDIQQGRTIRFLGDGKACSDYLSLLTRDEYRRSVVSAVAQWLSAADDPQHVDRWHAIEWEAIPTGDPTVDQLTSQLEAGRCAVLERPAASCYEATLPDTTSAYIQSRSKTNRLTMRRIQRKLQSGTQHCQWINSPHQLDDEHWELFVDLHQMRRSTLGEQGCFAFPPFGNFLREATTGLMSAGMCSLLFVFDNQTPMAVLHLLHNRDSTFVYQSGMDHGVTEKRPGFVATSIGIWWTIDRGARRYDFLRGDEAYKQRWRAEPKTTRDIRISSRRAPERLRHGWTAAGLAMKDWVKAGLEATGMR